MQNTNIQTVLKINAITSALAAVPMILMPAAVGSLLGTVPAWLVLTVGVVLAVFAIDVYLVSTRESWLKKFLPTIFWADVSWIVATPVVLVLFSEYLSLTGEIILIGVELMVMVYAVLEWRAMRQSRDKVMATA